MDAPYIRETMFNRMTPLVSTAEIAALGRRTVAVAGTGGVGFTHAECLVRMSIGGIKISDFDTFGPENVSRQFGATIHTMGHAKVRVLEERLRAINPALTIDVFDGIQPDNAEEFVEGADFICDAIDYLVIEPRRLLHREARRRGIPVVMSGPVGFGAILLVFDREGMSFDEFFDTHDGRTEEENLANWAAGFNPAQMFRHYHPNPHSDLRERKGAVSAACLLATSLTGTVVIRRLLNKDVSFKPVPFVYAIDYVLGKFVELHIPGGVRAIKADPDAYRR